MCYFIECVLWNEQHFLNIDSFLVKNPGAKPTFVEFFSFVCFITN